MPTSNEELARVECWLERLGPDIRELATEGYDRSGPGVLLLSEHGLLDAPANAPFYLPRSHPDFADTSAEIRGVVDAYDPESECVTAVVSVTDRVYLFLMDLSGTDGDRCRKVFH